MYVCICKAVTDRDIRRELRQGAKGLRELAQRLGAATKCGRCRGCIVELIREALAGAPASHSGLAVAPINEIKD